MKPICEYDVNKKPGLKMLNIKQTNQICSFFNYNLVIQISRQKAKLGQIQVQSGPCGKITKTSITFSLIKIS